jgi:cellulose synthase operon protein C
MRKLLRSLHDRLTARSGIALCLIAAATVVLPYVIGSRFVAQRREALALQRAHAHLALREFDKARSELQAALRLQPGDAVARRQLAATELALGNTELAFLEYQSLTEMHPEDPDGWIGLADLMEKSGLLEAPEAVLDKAIDIAAQRADARLLRGDIRFRLGRYYGALQDALAAVAAAPSDVTSWALLVRATARSQGTDAGIEAARRAIASAGEHPALLSLLASLLAQRGRTPDARAMLQREIAGSASGSDRARSARLALAQIELGADNAVEARKLLDALLSEWPADEEALALRAVVDARGGQLEPSLAYLDAAMASQPASRFLHETRDHLQIAQNDPAALNALLADMVTRGLGPRPAPPRPLRADAQTGRGNLGEWTREHWPGRLAEIRQSLEAALQRRDWAAAQRIVDSARQEYPSSAFAPFLGGILELARGNLDEAERRLSDALAIAPRLPAILAALGRTWSRKRGAAFAGQQLMDLAARDPELPIARYMAARAYIEAGDPLRAEASLRRGLQLQPDSPAPYKHLTDYYFGLDRAAEALEICREGLDRFPQDTDLQMMLAQMEAGTGQTRNAIRVYEELASRRPDLDLAQYKLAMLLAAQAGDEPRQRFIAVLQRLQGDMPSDPLLLDALGWMHYGAHDARRARALLEAAAKGAPEEPSLHYHLAMVYAQERELTLLRQELKSALESPRPFAERIEALRLLRQDELAPIPKGKAGATSSRH